MFSYLSFFATILTALQVALYLLGACVLILLIKALQIYIRKNS